MFSLGGGGGWGLRNLMHAAEEFPVKHGHLVGQILRAHQLKGGHGACRGTLLVWEMSLMQRHDILTGQSHLFTCWKKGRKQMESNGGFCIGRNIAK